MSKKKREKLNQFINDVDGFRSGKKIDNKKAEFLFDDGTKKIIDF